MTPDEPSSKATAYVAAAGALLVAWGAVGFFYSSSFGSPGDVEAVLGVLDANGWLNALHIATGAPALLAFGAGLRPRPWALALGILYAVVAASGFVAGSGSLVGLIPVDVEGNVLHAMLGAAGLGAAGFGILRT